MHHQSTKLKFETGLNACLQKLQCFQEKKSRDQSRMKKSMKRSTVGVEKRPRSRPLSAAQEKLRAKLDGGHFRLLNERLYSTTSSDALSLLTSDPTLFTSYHRGYSSQVRRWPYNPLDSIIEYMKTLPEDIVVADCGCGDARLAKSVPQTKVYSFDLVSVNDVVTKADIAHLPLGESCVDVCVFCLSLMGVNYGDFLNEAWRVLKVGGKMIVVEVASRFESYNAASFRKGVSKMGFREIGERDTHFFSNSDSSSTGVQSPLDRRRRNQGAGNQRVSKRNRGKSTQDVRTTEQSGTTPFFYEFMFLKEERKIDLKTAIRSLPPLRACTYKKR